MIHWIKYRRADGGFVASGHSPSIEDMNRQSDDQEAVVACDGAATTTRLVKLDPNSDALTSVIILDIDAIRAPLLRRIDADAEACRGRFITTGSGQAITYLAKQQEAAAFLADANASVPILMAEAAATGATVAELAAEVSAAAAAWLVIGAKIEAARRGAKKAIGEAADILGMTTAAAIDWAALPD
jgi:hypothetical protein